MTIENIKRAQVEARRFLDCSEDLLKFDTQSHSTVPGGVACFINHGKRSGTLRRASMDLTRALAEMRRA